MKVKCYCCGKVIYSKTSNGVFTKSGTHYFCKEKVCQEVFDAMATSDEWIYDE